MAAKWKAEKACECAFAPGNMKCRLFVSSMKHEPLTENEERIGGGKDA